MTCPRCDRDWPHVHVTEALKRAGLIHVEWASQEALMRGSCVHQAIALGEHLDESSIDPTWEPYYRAHQKWLRESKAVILASEVPVENRTLGYVGTLDAIAQIGNLSFLVDWKTGEALRPAVGPQTAGYLLGLSPEQRKQFPGVSLRAAVLLRGDGTYRWEPLMDRHDESVFKAALTCAQWQLAHE